MTPEQKTLVQDSFELVEPIAADAAKLFYGNLFAMDPALQSIFKGDMEEQGKKLMQMIGTAVRMLDRLDELVPVVQRLGVRHVEYGVQTTHYDTVGAALLKTLRQGLVTAEVETAWTVVYGVLSSTMINAAYPAQADV